MPPPSEQALAAARKRYREIESRDLFYRVATQLVADVRLGKNQDLTLGEALAVLLYADLADVRAHDGGAVAG